MLPANLLTPAMIERRLITKPMIGSHWRDFRRRQCVDLRSVVMLLLCYVRVAILFSDHRSPRWPRDRQ